MTRAQRVVGVVYCLLLAYCCVWIPWHVRLRYPAGAYERVGYGWFWAGPYRSTPITYEPPLKMPNGMTILREEDPRSNWIDLTAEPDLQLMGIRLLLATAFSSGLFFLASLWK